MWISLFVSLRVSFGLCSICMTFGNITVITESPCTVWLRDWFSLCYWHFFTVFDLKTCKWTFMKIWNITCFRLRIREVSYNWGCYLQCTAGDPAPLQCISHDVKPLKMSKGGVALWGCQVILKYEVWGDFHVTWVVGCWHGFLSAAECRLAYQLMPLPLTVSCFSEIQIGFTFLVLAHPGTPGQRVIKRVCVFVCAFMWP